MTAQRTAPTPAEQHTTRHLDLVVAGAPLDNDNRGVEALGTSVVGHLAGSGMVSRLTVLDNGWGVRPDPAWTGGLVERLGVRRSRRWHRQESWARIRADQALGGLGNPFVTRLARADALLDLSGGDSFTDLYGAHRLAAICAPKEAAVRAGRPLVLLPQTFGPFTTVEGRRRAERLVRRSTVAYARDAWSHEQLLDLAGRSADTSRLRLGVDVAFGLTPREPDPRTVARFAALSGELVVGVNVSGLLREEDTGGRFGLAGPYLRTMTELVRGLVRRGAVVVLVSHVDGGDPKERDAAAHAQVEAALSTSERGRVWRLSPALRAAELKWCIAQLEWFAGSRMHATIAALSSAVPAFGYAYSDKARGVFGTCGVADHVTDARAVAGAEAVERALDSFAARAQAHAVLRERVPAVVDRARGQLDEVLKAVTSLRDAAPGAIT
ncbi:polysaccharide pyruvyl transferase family protein [Georgenia satyanarayanai]|uniref:polysaccharide pyruvyl transferase family protein n=1 Tax=Georgenia satyanarayanai TaxID=860221 RepID=UPI002040B955|nr:polysaccharide pyruvyl transferase family protein [Georgenia satyanarayanai]MCM3660810.1 polysaccharide pyruvyl transferase family protein [Georgenia satyanarayanai]